MEQKLIELMESFTPVVAYTGVLGNVKQGSYIPAGEFFVALNKLRVELKLKEAKDAESIVYSHEKLDSVNPEY